MATFALIHGGGGSAWDWHLVARELREDGHDTTAVDLPCEDESAGWWDYADAVVGAIGDRSEVVVVGHSLGGFTAPLVCARIPVDLLVFVAAMMPSPGELFDDWWANSRYEASGYDDIFYHDVPPALAAEAQRRERDETSRALREPWPLAAWPGTPARYLLCRDDRMFPAAWARRHARERLRIEPGEMDGGHYISLSRPRELAERLSAYTAEIAHGSAGARRSKGVRPRTTGQKGDAVPATVPASLTITPVLVADLLAEGEPMPLYVHVIDHPDARVLVDTGMTELHPALADLAPRLRPLSKQDFDLAGIDIVVNTHLHADHCGGNHLFAGRPIYVQRRELDDARSEDDYTIREWVEAPGVRYVPVDGELELLPGLRLVPAPGHTRGLQVVVVETGGRPVVVGGDVAVWFGELDEPDTEGQLRVLALDPELVWLAHEHEPWRPHTV